MTKVTEDFFKVKKQADKNHGKFTSVGYKGKIPIAPIADVEVSASVSAASKSVYNDMVDLQNQTKTDSQEKTTYETKFNEKFTQIIQKIRKEVVIDSESSHKVITNVVDSAPEGQSLSRKDLNLRAAQYIWNNYAHETRGVIRGPPYGGPCTDNDQICTYEEKVCLPPKKNLPQTCTPFSFRVIAEFYQQALTKDTTKRELTKKTEKIHHAITSLKQEEDRCGSVGIMGLSITHSANAAMYDLNDKNVDQTRQFTEVTDHTREYNPNYLQILRHVTTEIAFGDFILMNNVIEWVDSVPISTPKTMTELGEMAGAYIRNNWQYENGGQIVGSAGHIYEEFGCPQIKITPPVGWCEKDSSCKWNEACINNHCKDACQSKECILPHETCSVSLSSRHVAKCECKKGWVRSQTGQCVRPKPGHCSTGGHCKAGDCCHTHSSCKTCPYGFDKQTPACMNDSTAHGQCKYGYEVERRIKREAEPAKPHLVRKKRECTPYN